MNMKKVLLSIAAALVASVAAGIAVSNSLREAVQNSSCAVMLVGIAVFFIGGIIYSAKADKEVAAQQNL